MSGIRWPRTSTVTFCTPSRRVVARVRSTGRPVGSNAELSAVMAMSSCSRKNSSPCSSEVGCPRKGLRSSASMSPCSTHSPRNRDSCAVLLTWPRASAAPLMPPAEVPAITSARAVLSTARSAAAYAPSGSDSAQDSRLSSWTTPPIHTARLTPPLSTTASRISSTGGACVVVADVMLSPLPVVTGRTSGGVLRSARRYMCVVRSPAYNGVREPADTRPVRRGRLPRCRPR